MTNFVRTGKFGDEQRQANRDWRKESVLALLRRDHEDDDEELHGQEHLNENTLSDGRLGRKSGVDASNVSGEHARDEAGGAHCRNDLGWEENETAKGWDSA